MKCPNCSEAISLYQLFVNREQEPNDLNSLKEPKYNSKCPNCSSLIGFSNVFYVIALSCAYFFIPYYLTGSQKIGWFLLLSTPFVMLVLIKLIVKLYVKNI